MAHAAAVARTQTSLLPAGGSSTPSVEQSSTPATNTSRAIDGPPAAPPSRSDLSASKARLLRDASPPDCRGLGRGTATLSTEAVCEEDGDDDPRSDDEGTVLTPASSAGSGEPQPDRNDVGGETQEAPTTPPVTGRSAFAEDEGEGPNTRTLEWGVVV